jgi:hypothetical protein
MTQHIHRPWTIVPVCMSSYAALISPSDVEMQERLVSLVRRTLTKPAVRGSSSK